MSYLNLLPDEIALTIYMTYFKKNVITQLQYNHNKNNYNEVIKMIGDFEYIIHKYFCLHSDDFYQDSEELIIYKFIDDLKFIQKV